MKQIKITETDRNYVSTFTSMLIQLGAKPIDGKETLFEVEDSFDVDRFHGLEVYNGEPVDPIAEKAWLEAYTGDFPFYLSLKAQLKSKGRLSPKQWDCVTKAVARDEAYRAQREVAKQALPKEFSLKVGQVLLVKKFFASKIAREAGYARAHYAFEVVAVEAETERAWRATFKMSAVRTSHCGCCGILLTNPESIAAGIGPICAEKGGVSFGSMSLEELTAKLSVTVSVTTWLPKSAVKQVLAVKNNC